MTRLRLRREYSKWSLRLLHCRLRVVKHLNHLVGVLLQDNPEDNLEHLEDSLEDLEDNLEDLEDSLEDSLEDPEDNLEHLEDSLEDLEVKLEHHQMVNQVDSHQEDY